MADLGVSSCHKNGCVAGPNNPRIRCGRFKADPAATQNTHVLVAQAAAAVLELS